nr:MAG TPA: hypothetical protein [Caudoviricetes sp.]
MVAPIVLTRKLLPSFIIISFRINPINYFSLIARKTLIWNLAIIAKLHI